MQHNRKGVCLLACLALAALGRIDPSPLGALQPKLRETLKVRGHPVYSPDGQALAITSRGNANIKLWDLKTGKVKATLEGHGADVQCVAFSPDGNTVASGCGEEIKL